MNWFFILIVAAMAGFVLFQFSLSRPGIRLEEAQAELKAGTAVLVDIRESGEWTDGVALEAALLPFSDLRAGRAQWRPFLERQKGRRLLLYCASGTRSGMAAKMLRAEGFDAVNAGSLSDWGRTGWPVHPPKHR